MTLYELIRRRVDPRTPGQVEYDTRAVAESLRYPEGFNRTREKERRLRRGSDSAGADYPADGSHHR